MSLIENGQQIKIPKDDTALQIPFLGDKLPFRNLQGFLALGRLLIADDRATLHPSWLPII